mmetsp:Transcript_15953/g.34531  ORF Transcript_15953/g.34531 Transcript_15953/m.34531 type:complete len:310 (-) Transcript_15953:227-1156(-)
MQLAAPSKGNEPSEDVRLWSLPLFSSGPGSTVLETALASETRHRIQDFWHPALRLPREAVEYVCAVCKDFAPHVRQEALLVLKRYNFEKRRSCRSGESRPGGSLQVVSLTCVNLALKHWGRKGLPEQKLHWLSCNSFTRSDFVAAEADVMTVLGGCVHLDGVLLADWVALLLHFGSRSVSGKQPLEFLQGVASHIADVLAFEDELMHKYPPSELALTILQTAVVLSTKRFQQSGMVAHLAFLVGMPDEKVLRLSERMLALTVGKRTMEYLLEGSAATGDDEDDRTPGRSPNNNSSTCEESPSDRSRIRS